MFDLRNFFNKGPTEMDVDKDIKRGWEEKVTNLGSKKPERKCFFEATIAINDIPAFYDIFQFDLSASRVRLGPWLLRKVFGTQDKWFKAYELVQPSFSGANKLFNDVCNERKNKVMDNGVQFWRIKAKPLRPSIYNNLKNYYPLMCGIDIEPDEITMALGKHVKIVVEKKMRLELTITLAWKDIAKVEIVIDKNMLVADQGLKQMELKIFTAISAFVGKLVVASEVHPSQIAKLSRLIVTAVTEQIERNL